MNPSYSIGLIGAGGITRNAHLKALRCIPEVQIAAVADVIEESAQSLAKDFEIPRVFTDYKELLNLEEIDAVLVTVPNFLHAQVAIDSMVAGKHVLCEKPMAINGKDAEKMATIQQRTKKTLMVALNNRFRRDVQFLKNCIGQGELGEIYFAKCGWMRRAGIPGWGGWFTSQAKSGGGPLIDIGVHMIDLALYIMGNPKPVSVVGSTYTKFGNTEKAKKRVWGVANSQGIFDVEDLATAFIRLDNGATLTVDVSWAANIEKDTVFVDLMGTKGGVSLDNEKGIAIFSEKFGEHLDSYPNVKFNDAEARLTMWKHFLHCMETGASPLSSPVQALYINKILDAIYESSRTGHEVII